MNQPKIYPFKFLDAYTQADKAIFFGRDDEIAQLYEMLFQSDLLLIYGASGTGKTSLIQCGLANQFKPYDWFPIAIRRKSNLNESLDKALSDALGGNTKTDDEDFESIFSSEKPVSPLEKKLKDIYLQNFRPIYLIFDQFEELYVLGTKDEQARFVQTVKEIMQIEQPIKILLSIREEYLGSLYEFEKAVPELLRKKLRIEPMNLDKVRQVLEGIDENPQTNVKLRAEEKSQIIEGIFQKIQGEEKTLFIQLPYLQVFLDKLYRQITQDESHQQTAMFEVAALQQIGDIGNVLRDFLEEQVIRIANQQKQKNEVIWQILSPLATLEGTKEPLSLPALQAKLPDYAPELLAETVKDFVNARILRYIDRDELYEVAHDSLAKQIAAKRSDEEIALLEVQQLIKTQTGLKAEAREYFSEKQLQLIAPYLPKLALTEAQKDWLNASQTYIQAQKEARARAEAQKLAEQEAERQRKVRVFRRNAFLIFIGLSIFALYSIYLLNQAQRAQRQAQTAQKLADDKSQEAKANLEKAQTAQKLADDKSQEAKANLEKAEEAQKLAEAKDQEAKANLTKAEILLKDIAQRELKSSKAEINQVSPEATYTFLKAAALSKDPQTQAQIVDYLVEIAFIELHQKPVKEWGNIKSFWYLQLVANQVVANFDATQASLFASVIAQAKKMNNKTQARKLVLAEMEKQWGKEKMQKLRRKYYQ
ncbi:MAG: hypothetical protein MUE85_06625 [Microscillaceae bacterium]|jgi:hypothetical protein|nr:hypothetical protein [Microscillaceae bacterium]